MGSQLTAVFVSSVWTAILIAFGLAVGHHLPLPVWLAGF